MRSVTYPPVSSTDFAGPLPVMFRSTGRSITDRAPFLFAYFRGKAIRGRQTNSSVLCGAKMLSRPYDCSAAGTGAGTQYRDPAHCAGVCAFISLTQRELFHTVRQ